MKKPKTPPTEAQIRESIRLRELFAERAGMSQLDFGQAYGIGNQGMVWQYLNADKPKGSVLNVLAAIKFAEGLNCRVSDFSPSIQLEIDRISSFSTKSEEVEKRKRTNSKTAQRTETATGKPADWDKETEANTSFKTSVVERKISEIDQEISDAYSSANEARKMVVRAILLGESSEWISNNPIMAASITGLVQCAQEWIAEQSKADQTRSA